MLFTCFSTAPPVMNSVLRYGLVGAALGHEGEDLALTRGERREALVAPPAREELAHYLGVEHGSARADGLYSRDELFDIGDAVL